MLLFWTGASPDVNAMPRYRAVKGQPLTGIVTGFCRDVRFAAESATITPNDINAIEFHKTNEPLANPG